MAGLSAPRSPTTRTSTPLPAQLLVQYVGFQDAPGRREYVLLAQWGEKVRQYVVWIPREAFDKRHALLQDGPDICYQKLLRTLIGSELVGAGRFAVTDAELTCYREAHAPRRWSPLPV